MKDIERHFQDLVFRVGLAQPRSANVRAKHYEPQSDTVRMFVLSLLSLDEGPIVFQGGVLQAGVLVRIDLREARQLGTGLAQLFLQQVATAPFGAPGDQHCWW